MRLAPLRVMLYVCLAALPSIAGQSLTVARLVDFIRSSVAQKLPDKEVAAYLANVTLTQKLDDSVIEELQTQGAGPRTVAALTHLADLSAKLPASVATAAPAPKPVSTGPAPPSAEEREKALREVREYALNYTDSLPNFVCLQTTRRSVDTNYQPGTPGWWSPADRLAEKLSFVDHREKYELITHNNDALIGKTWEAVGGAISRGEWASLLHDVFDPATEANFQWLRWGNIDNQLVHVFQYSIDLAHSKETIDYQRQRQITTPYHGLVFVPRNKSVVLRITVEPDIPGDFPVQDVHQMLDYKYADINGQQYLLPLTSQVTMRTGRIASKNEIQFRRYQKYSADTSIKFEDTDEPEPAPAAAPPKK